METQRIHKMYQQKPPKRKTQGFMLGTLTGMALEATVLKGFCNKNWSVAFHNKTPQARNIAGLKAASPIIGLAAIGTVFGAWLKSYEAKNPENSTSKFMNKFFGWV